MSSLLIIKKIQLLSEIGLFINNRKISMVYIDIQPYIMGKKEKKGTVLFLPKEKLNRPQLPHNYSNYPVSFTQSSHNRSQTFKEI